MGRPKGGKNHGLSKTRLHRIYRAMKERCYDTNSDGFNLYGARNIHICDEWLGANGFVNFHKWALENGYSDDLSIDRIDTNKDYSPQNCRWATPKQQANNTRKTLFYEYKNTRHSLTEWSEILGIPKYVLRCRIKYYKWSVEKAFTTPYKPYNKKGVMP